MKPIEDIVKIAGSMAHRHMKHNLYPQQQDYVQNAMEQYLKNPNQKFTSTFYFAHLNTYNKQFLREVNRPDKTNIEGIKEPKYDNINDICNKMEVKRFFNWLPNKKTKDMFKMKYEGYEDSEIATKYNCTRQHIHKQLTEISKQYRKQNDL